jgi:FtsP/CotA-like multicopper oxidase with cupredoxin domain
VIRTIPALGLAGVVVAGTSPAFVTDASQTRCELRSPEARRECRASLLPASYSIGAMGYPDDGGGMDHGSHHKMRSVTTLTAPARPADRTFRLTAARQKAVVNGRPRMAFTLNGTTPGPLLQVRQGELVEVVLRNRNIKVGTSLHWHGVDLSGRNDGVSGVTQNAVPPGRRYVYRFIVPDAGTYWYHSHQHADRQISGGLFGVLVVAPRNAPAENGLDLVAAVHSYGSTSTINGSRTPEPVTAAPGTPVRVRFVNTNNGPVHVAANGPFRVVAIDGFDVQQPSELSDTYVEVPAGGRADLSLVTGESALRVGVVGGPSLVIGDPGSPAPGPVASAGKFDPLAYGQSDRPVDLGPVDREFRYVIDQRSGYLNGRVGNWYTINGRSLPHVPMYMVHRGDVVRLKYVNRTAVPHPMHLHGHHFRVISRDGQPSTGAPWWADSLEVSPGQSYWVEFVADNPGVWMFHCHNLPHVRQGLMTHLMYENVRTPFRVGRVNAHLSNLPE